MNKLLAEIAEINTSGELSLVTLNCQGELFSSIIINHQEAYIEKGNKVYMVFKETEVSIGKNLSGGLSIRNRFKSAIEAIDKGILLSEKKLNFKEQIVTSIITTSSLEKQDLRVKEEVEGLLKTTELFIMKYE